MRFFLSKFVSVGLLFAILLVTVHLLFSYLSIPGIVSVMFALFLLLLLWWTSADIYDRVFRKVYGVKWIPFKALEDYSYPLSAYLQELLRKHDLHIKKLGFVDDDRPICITYGEGSNGIRLIISSGVLHHLDEHEMQAVIAHEVGHMVVGDFPVLTAAYLPAFLLYLPAKAYWRNNRSFRPLMPVGMAFYFLHLLLSLPVLPQSRLREYYADEFASAASNPNNLAVAISKISLAFISQSGRRKSVNFMEAARPFSIIDYKNARNLALAYLSRKGTGSWALMENLVIQDLYNPWPALFEINSSHPLQGKRLVFLCLKSESLGGTPILDLQRMYASKITGTLFKLNFIEDFIVYMIARFSPFLILLLLILGRFYDKSYALGVIALLYGLGVALLSLYSFSYVKFRNQTIREQMEDIYVSPIRGRPLILEGVIREKSSLGLDLPEDLIFADHSGEIFIGPRSLMPLVISPYISASSLMKLKDKRVRVKGWYMRGRYPKLIIDEVVAENSMLHARQRLFDMGLASLVISAGIILMMV
ncbi:MAG: M48 family metalloprotease [Candidatus Micrarchaeota archaeon]